MPVYELVDFLEVKIENFRGNKKEFCELYKNYERAKFFRKLADYGYNMILKPIKTYSNNGYFTKKADCDVDLAVKAIADLDKYDRILLLSGDIDFLPLCKFLKDKNKDILILAQPEKASKELKRFVRQNFLNFNNLKNKVCIKNEEVAQGGLF